MMKVSSFRRDCNLILLILLLNLSIFCTASSNQCSDSVGDCKNNIMWAATFSGFGEPTSVISFSNDFPKPLPSDNEVLIKLEARPVNPSDLMYIRGFFEVNPSPPPFPRVPGAEGAGVIEAVGKDVTDFQVGNRVAFWHGYETRMGTWAEYTVVPSNYLVPVPEGMEYEDAAQLVLNPLTMIGILEQFGNMQPGEWLIQNAANSACGKFIVQYLKQQGIRTINIVRHSESVDSLKALGADEVIALDADNLKARVMEITGGQGPKYGIDCVWGHGAIADLVDTLSVNGKVVTFGALGGPEANLEISPLLFQMRSIQGFAVTTYRNSLTKDRVIKILSKVADQIKTGKVLLPSEHFVPRKILDAISHAETPKKQSKTIILG